MNDLPNNGLAGRLSTSGPVLWAKTYLDSSGREALGISTQDHCINVGFVAQAILRLLHPKVRALLPGDDGQGACLLAALHDIGKITLGFLIKSTAWTIPAELGPMAAREAGCSPSDHALVSQVMLQQRLKSSALRKWAMAVGAHHGRPKGRVAKLPSPEAAASWAEEHRNHVLERLVQIFGALPIHPPDPHFDSTDTDIWLLAGLITVADWIGSNEAFFPVRHGLPIQESRSMAAQAVAAIGWPGGRLVSTSFARAFTGGEAKGFQPNPVQSSVAGLPPGLVIIEAPMGCGKTEAALHLAQAWIAGGHHHGLYFALPTQVTSNRIHRRIEGFLRNTLEGTARLRLAHGHAWLEDDFNLDLRPTCSKREPDDNPLAQVREARSWFASSKQALLAPYGVGTIDQALQGMVAVKHFFVRRFALAGKVVILDEVHSYDIYTGTLVGSLVGELIRLGCSVIILSATLTAARRRELIEAAGGTEATSPTAYPLITAASGAAEARHLTPEWKGQKRIALRTGDFMDAEVIEDLIHRAEAGQHVLWIRNTVIEAQAAFASLQGEIREGTVRTGLLHSRFPFNRRQELESDWLEFLGRNRSSEGPGSILIATQVVEQSVDIDLDFIVSDLAPTDMLIQRMGRLWRHPRPPSARKANEPELWLRIPKLANTATAETLKQSLGRSAHVYAPYVLLRTAAVWKDLSHVSLPDDIRPLLEATYAESDVTEPDTWQSLRDELEKEKEELRGRANAAKLVLGNPMAPDDDEQALTRRKSAPTTPLLLLTREESLPGTTSKRLIAPDGSSVIASDFEWSLNTSRFLHRWMVRVPRWMVPRDAQRPRWLGEHTNGEAALALLEEDGRLRFDDAESQIAYHPDSGVISMLKRPNTSQSKTWNDDDEFDQ
jgi:CRISPR-associated endonuclease/helicase Cas3